MESQVLINWLKDNTLQLNTQTLQHAIVDTIKQNDSDILWADEENNQWHIFTGKAHLKSRIKESMKEN